MLIIELSGERIDYAEEMGPIIVHFTGDGKPVMLEILDASEFMAEVSKIAMRSEEAVEIA